MSLLIWNARGLGSPRAFMRLRKLIRSCSPVLVFLLETKLSGRRAKFLFRSMGYDGGFHVDSVGRSGGLIMFWKSEWQVSILNYSRCHIDVEVSQLDGFRWRFSGIYGQPVEHERCHTWALLRRLSGISSLPWLCAGDFNEILKFSEKIGGRDKSLRAIRQFRDVLEGCNLYDLGFSGPKFTWRNGQEGQRHVQERLDRFVADEEWRRNFEKARVDHLGFWGSDHRALLLRLKPHQDIMGRRFKRKIAFRFEPWWMKEEECVEVICNAWQSFCFDGSVQSIKKGLRRCASELHMWSTSKFGVLPKRIKRVQDELEEMYACEMTREVVGRIKNKERELDSLLANEEEYWKQRARADWLSTGDKNTKYFHAKASQRRRKKQIEGIENSDGRWLDTESGVAGAIECYFQDIFTSIRPPEEATQRVVASVEDRITEEMSSTLGREFTAEEVRVALFEMGSLKAPGPDGFHAAFYQRNWATMSNDITRMCLRILNEGQPVDELNATLICLIPKVQNPTRVSDYRPISLCNVLYKLVTKTIANRLKLVLNEIISENQSAFVPGRLISDNILVAFELMHSLKQRSNGCKGWMALKLDMSKAYDMVEWSFVKAMMVGLGFPSCFISLIMNCITSAKFSCLVNGVSHGEVIPQRGLRQGCPLSPYLFLLCAHGLSNLLTRAENHGLLKGFACTRQGPRVSHLFFADDSLVFCRASVEDCTSVKNILKDYEEASGQRINFQKSSVTFSPNVGEELRGAILNCLGLEAAQIHEKYLGLPSLVGRNKKKTFEAIKNKVWQKL